MVLRLRFQEIANLFPKFLFAASLSQLYFPYQSIKFSLSFILLFFAAYLFQSILESLIAISLSIIFVAALTRTPLIQKLFNDKPAWRIALAEMAVYLLCAIVYRFVIKKNHKNHFFVELVPVVAMTVISFYWSTSRNLGGLNFMGQSEDNAAWFMGLSFGLSKEGGIRYVDEMSWGGGPVFGVFNGWIVGLKSLGLSREYTAFDNIEGLLSAFGLLLVLTTGSLTSVILRFARRVGAGLNALVPLSIAAITLTYICFTAVMGFGHYTFMVAIWFVACAVSVTELNLDSQLPKIITKERETIRPVLVAIFIAAAALSWRAITPVAILICGHFLFDAVHPSLFSRKKWSANKVITSGGLFLLLTYLFIKIFGGDTKRGLSIQNLKRFFSLEGRAATVSPLLLFMFVIFGIAGFLLLTESLTGKRNELAIVVPAYMLITFILMMLISLPTVNGIRYVIHKFELLLFISFLPLCFFNVIRYSQKIKIKIGPVLLLSLLLMPVLYDGSLNSGFAYPGSIRAQKTIWAQVASSELLSHPERKVVCLNTKEPDETFSDYSAYTCNRILIGIQGLEGNNDYEDWTRLGMWLEDTSRLRSLPDSYYENMTFIVYDPKFSRTGDQIFMSAIEGIPWEKVRAVDLFGNIVHGN